MKTSENTGDTQREGGLYTAPEAAIIIFGTGDILTISRGQDGEFDSTEYGE